MNVFAPEFDAAFNRWLDEPATVLPQAEGESLPAFFGRWMDDAEVRINAFLREMPRLSCDCYLLTKYGASCTDRPTLMLDENFERTFNLDNMEYELTEDCYRRFLRGEL